MHIERTHEEHCDAVANGKRVVFIGEGNTFRITRKGPVYRVVRCYFGPDNGQRSTITPVEDTEERFEFDPSTFVFPATS